MEKEYTQLCVWPACTLGDQTIRDFETFMLEAFEVRVKYEAEVITNGSVERKEEGGRHDLLFYIHSEDTRKFALRRLRYGIRWWEDVIKYNNNSYLYSKEILDKYPATW